MAVMPSRQQMKLVNPSLDASGPWNWKSVASFPATASRNATRQNNHSESKPLVAKGICGGLAVACFALLGMVFFGAMQEIATSWMQSVPNLDGPSLARILAGR